MDAQEPRMAELIPLFKVFMSPDAKIDVGKVLDSGYITQGPKVKEFEAALHKFLGIPALTVNSATSALTLALRLADVGHGDEVISTPMTCQATNVPILAMGAKPVWADVDPRTGLIDPDSIKKRITKKTKAIMIVDWGGAPCNYDEIYDVLGRSDTPLIEDAAHAFGSTYKGIPVGQLADFTAFSFQAIKHLTTVDGGALTALDQYDLERGRLLRWYGIDREANTKEFRGEVDAEEWGYKFHMNDVNATIGLANIPHARDIIGKHMFHARVLDAGLNREIYTSTDPDYDHASAHWLYTTLLPNSEIREQFKAHMHKENIQVSQVHWRNDKMTAFKPFECDLPGVDEFSSRMICVPVHWDVDIERVLDAMNRFVPNG